MAPFSLLLFKAVGLIERDREGGRIWSIPSSPLECRSNELKRQSAPSSDYFVEREEAREGEGRKGVRRSVGWDGMGVVAAAAPAEGRKASH